MHSPTDIKARREQKILQITWEDGPPRDYPFWDLRCGCQCAGCVDENTGQRVLVPANVPRDITVRDLKLIGNYALKVTWSDGHDQGLYTWDYLYGFKGEPR